MLAVAVKTEGLLADTSVMPSTEQQTIAMTVQPTGEKTDLSALTLRKSRLEHTQSGWELALSIALGVAAVVAFLLFIFDFGVRRYSKRVQEVQDEIIRAKDDQLATDLKAKDVEIGGANEKAGEANKVAAKTNERRKIRIRGQSSAAASRNQPSKTAGKSSHGRERLAGTQGTYQTPKIDR